MKTLRKIVERVKDGLKGVLEKTRGAAGRSLTVAALCGAACAAHGQSSVAPRIYDLGSVWCKTNTVAVGTVTNLYETFSFTHDLAVETTVSTTNANLNGLNFTNVTSFDLSIDGTTFSGNLPIIAGTNSVAGTNTTTFVTIIPRTAFDGCKSIRWTSSGTGATNWIKIATRLGVVP